MNKANDRLPSKKQLEAMGSEFAWSTLDVMAKQSREVLERDDVSFVSPDGPMSVKQGRAREARKLNRVYELAHELGHHIGQPDYIAMAMEAISWPAKQKASWRLKKADRNPKDWKNSHSAGTLEKLSESKPTDYNLARRFCNRYCDKSLAADQRLSDHLTDVGFRTHPKSVDDLLRIVLGISAKDADSFTSAGTSIQAAA